MLTARTLATIICVGLALVLTGCTNETTEDLPQSPAASPSSASDDSVTVLDYVEETESATPSPEPITPNSDLMKEMTCNPLPQDFLEANKSEFGIPLKSVHIKVGEGLYPGQEWWVVVYDLPADAWSGRPPEIRRYLTTSPGVPNYKGDWIEIGNREPWKSVHWDDEKLVVAQSALDKALECIENEEY